MHPLSKIDGCSCTRRTRSNQVPVYTVVSLAVVRLNHSIFQSRFTNHSIFLDKENMLMTYRYISTQAGSIHQLFMLLNALAKSPNHSIQNPKDATGDIMILRLLLFQIGDIILMFLAREHCQNSLKQTKKLDGEKCNFTKISTEVYVT